MIRRALLALALAAGLGACAIAASARADTFAVLAAAPSTLPGADTPNAPGSIVLPPSLSTPPAAPEKLSYDRLESLWKGAGAAYGIPWQVLAAINEVESNFGRNMGPSSAGAIGWMQFMPSTWERWGLDANGDGVADPWTAEDAIYAAARYLAASGGHDDVARAVFAYNHAQWYVDEVLGLAKVFHDSGATVTFTLDRLQQRLQTASAQVLGASRALVRAQARERVLAAHEDDLARRAQATPLLSDQLDAEKRAVLAAVRHDDAAAEVARLQAALDAAQRELDSARA
ncbi:MAG TPA: lytic murein transglycosylase, partial [Gaiellaceae bacterium]